MPSLGNIDGNFDQIQFIYNKSQFCHEILVHIAHATRDGSDEPTLMRSHAWHTCVKVQNFQNPDYF